MDDTEQKIQFFEDNIATKKRRGETIPQTWIDKLDELRRQANPPVTDIETDCSFYGHPTNQFTSEEDYALIPIRATKSTDFSWRKARIDQLVEDYANKVGYILQKRKRTINDDEVIERYEMYRLSQSYIYKIATALGG